MKTITTDPPTRKLRLAADRQAKRFDAPALRAAMVMTRNIGPRIASIGDHLHEWRVRRSQRRRLLALDDRILKDIGLSRADAETEYRKPFWR